MAKKIPQKQKQKYKVNVAAIILAVILVVSAIFIALNVDKIKLFMELENASVQDYYNQGYKDGQANTEQLQNVIDKIQADIDAAIAAKNAANAAKEDAEEQLAELKQQLAELQSSLDAKDADVDSKLTLIEDLQTQIQNLMNDYNLLQQELEDQLAYYEELVKTLQAEDKAIVTYKVDGDKIFIDVVTKGTKLNMYTPTLPNNIRFLGWSIDGVSIVDTNTYNVTGDVTFIAITENLYRNVYIYDVNGNLSSITKVDYASLYRLPEPAVIDNYTFIGWDDGNSIFTAAAITIFEDEHLTPVYRLSSINISTYNDGENVGIRVRGGGNTSVIYDAIENVPTDYTSFTVTLSFDIEFTNVDSDFYEEPGSYHCSYTNTFEPFEFLEYCNLYETKSFIMDLADGKASVDMSITNDFELFSSDVTYTDPSSDFKSSCGMWAYITNLEYVINFIY